MPDTASRPSVPASPVEAAGFLVRSLTDDDWAGAKAVDAAAFGYEPDHDYLDTVSLPAQDIRRFTGVFDPALDGMLVGIGAIQSRDLTLPGRGPVPVAAVTWVGVRPDQQRRGVLRQVMTAQLHGLHEQQGEAVAILTASEGGIYGRFGYGMASVRVRLEIPAPTGLLPGVRTEPVLEMPREAALPLMKPLHEAIAPRFPGYLDRSPQVWASLFTEHPFVAKGVGPQRFALHPEGYVVFRLTTDWSDRGPNSTLSIVELSTVTPLARASLWRHVLSYPLVRSVVFRSAWADEPIAHLLANPRVIASDRSDNVWVRLVDLERALPLRTYRTPATVVAAVSDDLCPWNSGTWRLDLGLDGGTAQRTDDAPQVELDIRDLGAAFLGGTPIAALAAAGRVTGDPSAIGRLDLALATALQPWTPEGF